VAQVIVLLVTFSKSSYIIEASPTTSSRKSVETMESYRSVVLPDDQ